MTTERQRQTHAHTNAWIRREHYEGLRFFAGVLGIGFGEMLDRAAGAYLRALEESVEVKVRVLREPRVGEVAPPPRAGSQRPSSQSRRARQGAAGSR